MPTGGVQHDIIKIIINNLRFVSCGTLGNANKIQLTNPFKLNFFDIFGNSNALDTVLT